MEEKTNLRKKVFSAFKWNILDSFFQKGGTFAVSIVLAQLLSPAEFGIIGMVMVFMGVSNALADVGFSSAIIQKEKVNQTQLSTVFYINLMLSFGIYAIFYLSAQSIANFYGEPIVKDVVRVMTLVIVINGTGQVQKSLYSKALNFRILTIVSIISLILSSIIAISMTYWGWGVWALVVQQVALAFFNNVLYWLASDWRPTREFSLSSIKDLFDYGVKLFASSVLQSVYERLDTLIIGRVFQASTLGLYTRALSFQNIVKVLSTTGLNVLFPAFAKKQNDKVALAKIFLLIFEAVSLLSMFLSALLWLIAKPMFLILLGEEWVKASDYFQILLFITLGYPISVIMMNLIRGIGDSGLYLKLEIYKKLIQAPALVIAIYFSIETFLWVKVFAVFLSVLLNMYYISKLLDISLPRMTLILLKNILIIAPCLALIYVIFLERIDNNILFVFSTSILFSVLFGFVALIFHRKLVNDIRSLLTGRVKK